MDAEFLRYRSAPGEHWSRPAPDLGRLPGSTTVTPPKPARARTMLREAPATPPPMMTTSGLRWGMERTNDPSLASAWDFLRRDARLLLPLALLRLLFWWLSLLGE